MKPLPLTLFLLLGITIFNGRSFAQNETWYWYTGYQIGLDFATSPPTVLYDGKTASIESTSAISDACGNLLFYTDGHNVWSSDHNLMEEGSGLGGGCLLEPDEAYGSATQGVIITPFPGNCYQYIIFTTGCSELAMEAGLRYSIVDMRENGGLGKVVSKSNFLYDRATEKLNAVFHANNEDVWLISRKYGTNEFYVYLVDSDGIQTTPIISSVGQISDATGQGGMQISPDGSRLVLITGYRNPEFFSFDNQTGVITSDFVLPDPETIGYYSVAFSPSGEKVYLGTTDWFNDVLQVDQFDLSENTPEATFNSKTTLIDLSISEFNFFGGLQLGMDGFIYTLGRYIQQNETSSLDVILDPESEGVACNYTLDYLEVDSEPFAESGFGFALPNFFASYLAADYESPENEIIPAFDVQFIDSCLLEPLLFFDESLSDCEILRWEWNFGDPSSGGANTSSLQNPEHLFTSQGTYLVSLEIFSGCESAISYQEVNVGPQLLYGSDPIADQSFCIGDSITAAWPDSESVSWSTGEMANTISLSNSGDYWAEITVDECTLRDSFTVTEVPFPENEFQDEYQWCRGSQFAIALPEDDNLYFLNGEVQEDSFFIELDGIYEIEISNGICITEGQFRVSGEGCPECKLYIPNAFSPNDDGFNDGFQSYSSCLPEDFEMQVFDRWGGKVFETNNMADFWNGKKNGTSLDSGIYVYWIRATFYEDRVAVSRIYKGDIALIR